jgi:hypothetical protein
MTNPLRTQNSQRKKQQRTDHKASYNMRKLRRNRRGVWVSNDN